MLYEECRKQAIADLKNYHQLKGSIKSMSQRIQFMQKADLYSAPSASEKVMSSKDSDSAYIHYISQLEEMESRLTYAKMYLFRIDNALSMLLPKDRDLLMSYYVNRQRKSVTRMAEENFADRSWIYRKAQKALENYIALYFDVSKS